MLTLHNWLRKDSDIGKVYFSPTLVSREDPETGEIIERSRKKEIPRESWESLSNTRARNSANEAKHIRKEFTDYFTNESCIPWQWKCARVDIQTVKHVFVTKINRTFSYTGEKNVNVNINTNVLFYTTKVKIKSQFFSSLNYLSIL